MKRWVWLLLAVFCTALVQVQPVAASPHPAKACGCCQIPGDCGTPGCSPAPAPAPVADYNLSESVQVSALPAGHAVQPADLAPVAFYLLLSGPASSRPAFPVPLSAAPPASVPFFKAHCSFLI